MTSPLSGTADKEAEEGATTAAAKPAGLLPASPRPRRLQGEETGSFRPSPRRLRAKETGSFRPRPGRLVATARRARICLVEF